MRKVIGGVHCVVAQKFPGSAMKRVGPGTGDDVGRRTCVAAKLGVRVVTQNLELGDGMDRWLRNEASINRAFLVGAVDHEIIRFRALAIDRISLILPRRSSRFE